MNKCRQKFLDKLRLFITLPIEKWNYYQLLGYLLDQTDQMINLNLTWEREGMSPSDHPQLECMRSIWKLHFKHQPQQMKQFVDYCLAQRGKKLKPNALRFMIEEYLAEHQMQPDKITPIDRSTALPAEVITILPHLKTYGELAFAYHADHNVLSQISHLHITEQHILKVF